MAFLKFGKKKEELLDAPMPALEPELPKSSPIEQVSMMKQQGYTNNQIVQALQSQGYSTNQVYDAINQAGMMAQQAPQQEMGMHDYGQPFEQSFSQSPPQQQPAAARESVDDERIQEVAEAIIEEKWEDLAKDIKKVIEWKEKSEDRIAKLEQQIIDLRMGMDTITKNIMGKIASYDQNIVDVGTEIKAMEKVFQKVLPTMTESVNKLERMTKGYREPKK